MEIKRNACPNCGYEYWNEIPVYKAVNPNGEFVEINSLYGHDGFLLEYEQLHKIIKVFLGEK